MILVMVALTAIVCLFLLKILDKPTINTIKEIMHPMINPMNAFKRPREAASLYMLSANPGCDIYN
jgi:hypothetical protein